MTNGRLSYQNLVLGTRVVTMTIWMNTTILKPIIIAPIAILRVAGILPHLKTRVNKMEDWVPKLELYSCVDWFPRPFIDANPTKGINNIFVVIPQFLVTGISAVIFAIFDPDKSALHGSPHGAGGAVGSPTNGTTTDAGTLSHSFLHRSEDNVLTSNSVVYIFRSVLLNSSLVKLITVACQAGRYSCNCCLDSLLALNTRFEA